VSERYITFFQAQNFKKKMCKEWMTGGSNERYVATHSVFLIKSHDKHFMNLLRRKLFFLLDRWHVPRAERVWLVVMMGISVVAWTAQAWIQHPDGIWKQDYTQEREHFEQLFATHIQEHNQRMLRYGSLGESRKITPVSGIDPYPPKMEYAAEDSVFLDLNRASMSELQQIKGIGPSTAQKIMDWRTQKGPFESLGQLIEVKGIGPKSLQKMRPFLFVRDSVDLEDKEASNAVPHKAGSPETNPPKTDPPKPDSIDTSS
jgi:competence protein ComEA